MKLNSKQVATLRDAGRYGDGGGLYLQISATGSRSWVLRYERNGRERMLGLGSLGIVGLAQARERAQRARLQLLDNVDPVDAKKANRAAVTPTMTFRKAATEFYKQNEKKWSANHPFLVSLEQYAFPTLGHLDVRAIDLGAVQRVIEPFWLTKTETMRKVRGRIETVLDYTKVKGYRSGENPARWGGNLEHVLPSPSKVKPVQHLAALPWREVSAFVAQLRQQEGTAARALELTILTATRTGEVLGARWSEIDFENATWTISGSRTKTREEQRVPLAEPALALLRALPTEEGNDHVFIGRLASSRLGSTSMADVTRALRPAITTHGFRSCFRDWCAEATSHENIVCEMALGHRVSSEVERAYRRGDLFTKRRVLMADWANYCSGTAAGGNVVPMVRAAGG